MRALLASALLTATIAEIAMAATFQRPAGAADSAEVVAGYRALFTCSAHFFAGRELEDILAVELVDLPKDLPPPRIDTRRQLVEAVDAKGRVAVAAYRDTMGCTILPPTWSAADATKLPTIAYPAPPDTADVPFPRGDRAKPRPTARQKNVVGRAFDGQSFGAGSVTIGVVVVKDGQLVAERYAPGFGVHTGYRTWSTAKSITATLIGIAARDGIVDLEAPAQIPEWQFFDDPRRAITLKHLLWMSSGLYSEGANTNAVYFGGQDIVSSATTTHLEVEPNTRWKYANNDTLLLVRALRASLADDLRFMRYPYDELFHRIGMYHTRMETDHLGNFVGSSQVYTTARDLARFGLLYLNEGEWFDKQILPRAWVDFVASAAPALPRQTDERGYGAQFWLMDTEQGVPPGTYTTAGAKGQFATVVPAHDMVIVRTGVNPSGAEWRHDEFVNAIVAAFD
jgi:CubicO group peptidase (beta-lactamase class C family)